MDVKELRQHPLLRWVFLPVARIFVWIVFLLLGPLIVRGKARIPRKTGLLVLSNHLADIDPVVVQLACPRPIYFMAKSELFEMPVLGWIIRKFKAFPVKRGEPDRTAIKKAVALLKAGETVCVFPEGELSEQGHLLPLKPGVALIVRMAGVPVICLGLKNTNRIMPYGKVIPRPAFRKVTAHWGEPRMFEKDVGVEEMMEWAEAQLRSLTS